MSKQKHKDIFATSKNKLPIFVLDVDTDSTIQQMISDATSDDVESYIKLELDDIRSILNTEGLTSSMSSNCSGSRADKKSLRPLINHYRNCNIKAILICFTTHETFPLMEISEAMNEVNKVFDKDEEIILSVLIDNTLDVDEVHTNSIIKHRGNVKCQKKQDS
jgi:cell division GTPase FtsZ